MQNLRCTAEFEACGTELRYFQVYEAGQRAPTQWLKLVKYSLWSVEKSLKGLCVGLWFGSQGGRD